MPLLVAWFLWQLGIVVYPATWSFWATMRFGWDAAAIGWSLAFSGFLTVIVQTLFTGPAVRWLGERNAAIAGLATTAIALLAYALAYRVWQVYAFFLVGAFGAFVYPALSGMLSKLVDEKRQGGLQGVLSSLNSVAAIVGPFFASQSLAAGAEHHFPGAAFLLASILTVAALSIVSLLVPTSG
jgi:DHA1 family tetracycline resistance protein-like MFS transporter